MRIDVSRYAEDPRCIEPDGLRERFLADLAGPVSKMRLQRNRCLVATYINPAVTKGGIIIPGKTQEEDRWQGKVGLLLAVGPSAFDFEEVRDAIQRHTDAAEYAAEAAGVEFTSEAADLATLEAIREIGVPEVGDWVVYRTSETYEVGIPVHGEHVLASCRFITDDSIITTVADPRNIY